MKMKANSLSFNRLLSGCATFALAFVLMSTTAPTPGGFTLKNVKAVTSGEEYSMPVWSPDGTRLLVSSAHGMKLHVVELGTRTVTQLSDVEGSGFNASWSPDGKNVYYRHKSDRLQVHPEIKRIRMSDRQVQNSSLNPNGLLSASKAQSDKDVVVSINIETLGIEAALKDGSKSWAVTTDGGQYYRPLLSPDQQTVVVHEGSEMYLFATDGSGLIRHLGTGLAGSWSPDGKHLMTFLDESQDGHTISGSELYMVNVEDGQLSDLTQTPDVYELWPAWSADGTKIAFEDARTGVIYVADIVEN